MAKVFFQARIDGWKELQAALKELPPQAHTLSRVVKQSADPVVRRAWELAPKLTGAMANSIDARVVHQGSDGVTIDIGPDRDHEYGFYHEFGTARLPARPFLRPALDQHKSKVLDTIGQDLWVEISKTAARAAKRMSKG